MLRTLVAALALSAVSANQCNGDRFFDEAAAESCTNITGNLVIVASGTTLTRSAASFSR